MTKRLYVGNLPYSVTEDQLRDLFTQVGEIERLTIITDRETGRSKGFGFVEMATEELAQEAIRRFNGYSLSNRSLTVNEAKPREQRTDGPRPGGFRDGGGYGRDSYGGSRDSYGGYGGGRDSGGYGGGRDRRDDYGGGRDRRDRY